MAIEPVNIGAIGAGRMGRGIALAFACSGYAVSLIDIRPRTPAGYEELSRSVRDEMRGDLDFMVEAEALGGSEADDVAALIRMVPCAEASHAIAGCDVIFECVSETIEAKKGCFDVVNACARRECIIASTTSTISADVLAAFVDPPERFCNAHWLNPAHLMPLIELSPCAETADETKMTLRTLFENIGKVPVECRSSPGYIVPRIQALAMNEAARLVEEGVASAEDIDTATRVGFGLRFAVLGLLEFIDWGGADILHSASRFLARNVDAERFATPGILEDKMRTKRRGLRDGAGFHDFRNLDVRAYRRDRLRRLVALLKVLDLMPRQRG